MATKKKSSRPKTAAKKAAAKTKSKAPGKARTAQKAAPKAKRKAPSKTRAAKVNAVLAADSDPMGCCTFTNSAGQIQMRNMKQSMCSKISGSTFEAGIKCNG